MSSESFKSIVLKSVNLTPRVKGVRFQIPPGQPFPLKAGQHIQILIPTEAGPKRGYYSVASPPQVKEYFEVCVTFWEEGLASRFIHQLKEGDQVDVIGPMGKSHLNPELKSGVVFIGAGSGIAPLRSMIMDLYSRGFDQSIDLIFGNRSEEDILYKNEWEKLASLHPGFRALHVLSQPSDQWSGAKGRVQNFVNEVTQPADKEFYICGPTGLVQETREKLLELGVHPSKIHYEGSG